MAFISDVLNETETCPSAPFFLSSVTSNVPIDSLTTYTGCENSISPGSN